MIPETSVYRQTTSALYTQRLRIVESEPDIDQIESKIDNGQMEELLKQADDELSLIKKMKEWKVWEGKPEPFAEGQWKYFEQK